MQLESLLLILTILLSAVNINAATIRGKTNSTDAPVKLVRYVDHLTDSLLLVKETVTDKNGNFNIDVDVKELAQYKVIAGDVFTTFFINNTSSIFLEQRDAQLLIDDGANGINKRLDSLFASVLLWSKRSGMPVAQALDELKAIDNAFRVSNDKQWNTLLEYYIDRSELQYTTTQRIKTDESGAVQRFNVLEQTILPRLDVNNPFYLDFVKHHIESRVSQTGFRRTRGGMSPFSKVIGETRFLTNDSVREMSIVLGVEWLYERRWYGKSDKISELDDSVKNLLPKMKITYFRHALAVVSGIHHRFKRGDDFPVIKLNDATNKKSDITQLRSDYILVSFWATWCGPCRESMKQYESLQNQFGGKLSIVSISADKEFETMRTFLNKNNYTSKWLALYNGDKGKYLEALKIESYPTYYLLDKNKKVITSPKWDELHETLNSIIH
ncbi:MAG: TlpA family protein disulfide reductase [Sphingobacteriales bacterium]|nr:MAG: TlpA family protein disulfide reductase [Sphingobacteriales bacterium]